MCDDGIVCRQPENDTIHLQRSTKGPAEMEDRKVTRAGPERIECIAVYCIGVQPHQKYIRIKMIDKNF